MLNNPSNPAAGYRVFYKKIYDRESVRNADVSAHDYALYLQDAWKPMPRLTFNVGIRFDHVAAKDNLLDVQVQEAWEIGPRFGVTYALTADRTNVLRGTWGRIADIPNSTYLGTAGTVAAGFTEYIDNNGDGTLETVNPQPASSRVSSDRRIDPERHQLLHRRVAGRLSAAVAWADDGIDVSWVSRNYKDRPAQVEVNGIYTNGVVQRRDRTSRRT